MLICEVNFTCINIGRVEKVHPWLFTPRKAKNVIYTFLTNQ